MSLTENCVQTNRYRSFAHLCARSLMPFAIIATLATNAEGALTDLSSVPLSSASSTTVLPNLMFVLDDSGSMGWTYMPDTANNFSGDYGYTSPQCNGVYYDRTVTYLPPLGPTGASYPDASFTAAWTDGFNTSAGTTNLSTSFQPSSSYTAAAAFYYTYSGTQTTEALKKYYDTSSTFYQECNSSIGSSPGSTKFTKVTVSSTSGVGGTDERVNFANWYSYYRNRMLMMKTAAGRAFSPIGNSYRVGFMTINNNVAPDILNFATFDSTQKSSFYSLLYGAVPGGYTPLRMALSNVGRIYAGKVTSLYGTTITDPVQYSCQQNFTILSTDGFWNSSAGYQLDGTTALGNQDSGETRPMWDGGSSSSIRTATLTIGSSSSSTSVTSVKVNALELLSSATSSSSTSSTVASRIASRINNCTSTITGSCGIAGYSATSSGSVVTITAPSSLGDITYTPTYTKSGSKTVTPTAFVGSTVTSGGTSNTLADVAEYYYVTDLRSSALGNATGALGSDVATDNVPSSGSDGASWQHMTTFTLGLGARGRMVFSSTYATDTSGDYFAVKNGSTANPSGGICSWQTSGACNWPTPGSDTIENIDDMWHAAVNGRGTYFSATNPSTLATALSTALAGVSARMGASAAATTSNPNVTSGDNFVFSSTFNTVSWDGELQRQQLDLATGVTSSAVDWTARDQLDAVSYSSRTIYTYSSSASNKLKTFQWSSLSSAEQAYFNSANIASLSQFCSSGTTCLSSTDQANAAGSPLVNFLRGERTNEGVSSDTSKYYRSRSHVLGDIVDAEAVYVKASMYTYADSGYTAFISTNASRTGMVYAASNDGMLHAFNATTGVESWAYIPAMVLPNLYKLADKNYANLHQYYLDGTPSVGDIYTSTGWKTILVAGLNGGGQGYYALDVTDPAAPKALWEFTNANLGYTYGNPVITKLANGTWVVMFGSGYNNVTTGDGVGRLFVLNANTGALETTVNGTGIISTGVGSTGTPSGLARIIAWADDTMNDNTAKQVYGGDMLGNVWRFDVNNTIGAGGYDAQLLVTLLDSSSNPQPITAKPEIGLCDDKTVVFVGTGRYLGTSDLSSTQQQSFYAIKDNLDTTTLTNPRGGGSGFIQQTQTSTTCPLGTSTSICTTGQSVRTSTSNDVDFATDNGWYFNFPDSGERDNTDPTLALGTLAFNTNTPNANACTVGGTSFRYFVNYCTGAPVSTAGAVVGVSLGNALATRPVIVRLPNNTIVELTRMSDGTTITSNVPIGSGAGTTRRVSWRELQTEQ